MDRLHIRHVTFGALIVLGLSLLMPPAALADGHDPPFLRYEPDAQGQEGTMSAADWIQFRREFGLVLVHQWGNNRLYGSRQAGRLYIVTTDSQAQRWLVDVCAWALWACATDGQ